MSWSVREMVWTEWSGSLYVLFDRLRRDVCLEEEEEIGSENDLIRRRFVRHFPKTSSITSKDYCHVIPKNSL